MEGKVGELLDALARIFAAAALENALVEFDADTKSPEATKLFEEGEGVASTENR